MNSFLELHTSSDYRLSEREYHTSTWEYITAASDSLIPFQWTGGSDADYVITKIDTDGTEDIITGRFHDNATLISGWTQTGTGDWTVASDSILIAATDADSDDEITSNTFTLTAKKSINVTVSTVKFNDLEEWELRIEKDGTPVYTKTDWSAWDGEAYYTVATSGSDYTVVVKRTDSGGEISSTGILPTQTKTLQSGNYHWYPGSTLGSGPFDDIFRLRIVHGAYTYYSDWIDPCEYTDKAKITISCSQDYGGKKYVDGFTQFMYKDASIRRDPQAEIEILGDTLNGERINEKITAAVRYTMRMKCTETEFEALVHGMAGTIAISDGDGKAYDAQNVALANPAMSRTNGIVELTFVDGNNINAWTRDNADL